MRKVLISICALGILACTGEIAGLGPESDPATETFAPILGVNVATMTKTADGLYYREVSVGTGFVVAHDTTVRVNFSGYLKDGSLFDSGAGVLFPMNALVAGVREGITGMAVGGRRKLVVRSGLGYGQNGNLPLVPRQATLVFDIELVSIP